MDRNSEKTIANPILDRSLVERGFQLRAQSKFDEAITVFQEVLRVNPSSYEPRIWLATVLFESGQQEHAINFLRSELPMFSGNLQAESDLRFHIGAFLRRNDFIHEAIEQYASVLERDPTNFNALISTAIALQALARNQSSEAWARRAIAIRPERPDAHVCLAMALLAQGKFQEGWLEFEWRLKAPDCAVRDFPVPRWQGQPLDGSTVFVHSEQGFGDTFQFIRYLTLVKDRGAEVIFGCQKPLKGVLRHCPGIDRVVVEGEFIPRFDYHCPLLSLPHVLRHQLSDLPAQVPYLVSPVPLRSVWREQLQSVSSPSIGICWQGRDLAVSNKQSRSIPIDCFRKLADQMKTRFISLQKDYVRDHSCEWLITLDGVDRPQPFVDTAAIISSLDLVITADTSIAHLAGALGKPVWIALSFGAEWRWLQDPGERDWYRSPWYPSARLFRQRQLGDWEEVFSRIGKILHAYQLA